MLSKKLTVRSSTKTNCTRRDRFPTWKCSRIAPFDIIGNLFALQSFRKSWLLTRGPRLVSIIKVLINFGPVPVFIRQFNFLCSAHVGPYHYTSCSMYLWTGLLPCVGNGVGKSFHKATGTVECVDVAELSDLFVKQEMYLWALLRQKKCAWQFNSSVAQQNLRSYLSRIFWAYDSGVELPKARMYIFVYWNEIPQ